MRNTTTFHVAKMDCSAEEQLVRMALAQVGGVGVTQIDLDRRTVTVDHQGESAPLRRALESLDLDTTEVPTPTPPAEPAKPGNERSALATALAINACLFIAELITGLIGRSMGLVADSLDMLADAVVYALSLLAVGTTLARKQRLARSSGYLQFGLAVAGLGEVLRRLVTAEGLPDVTTMIVMSTVALAGNIATLLILRRAKSDEVHFQASWIFTSNDIKVNTLVIAAAVVVTITNNSAPDLVVGAAIFLIVANGARRILALAR